MGNYVIEAHRRDNRKPFSITLRALSNKQAVAIFVCKMRECDCTVIIERLVGDPINLTGEWLSTTVVLDRSYGAEKAFDVDLMVGRPRGGTGRLHQKQPEKEIASEWTTIQNHSWREFSPSCMAQ